MQNAFYEICGENAELLSDIGARFQAVASELFNLACYSEHVMKQAFVQTASGEYLDRHAEMRDMTRKTASKASGELTFFAAEVSENDIEIPVGTICSVDGKEYIQFATTESAVIEAGELSVTVPAVALKNGSAYNVKAGKITVIVNPPGSVDSVNNEFAFCGGYDNESDDALRKRLLSSYRVPSTGLSLQSMKEGIMKLDDVIDCYITKPGVFALNVYVRTKSGELSQEISDSIQNSLLFSYISQIHLNIYEASPVEYSLTVTVNPLFGDSESVIDDILCAVKNYTDGVKIGESISLAEIQSVAAKAAAADNCIATSPQAVNGTIVGSASTYLIPDEIVVQCYE